MKALSRIQRVKNRTKKTKKVISSVKNLIRKKYTYQNVCSSFRFRNFAEKTGIGVN